VTNTGVATLNGISVIDEVIGLDETITSTLLQKEVFLSDVKLDK